MTSLHRIFLLLTVGGRNRSQTVRRDYQVFPCQCQARTHSRPGVVGEVTLQDIDIIGAIGDSDTAAFAANSRGLDYFTEYWGISFVTGTDRTWQSNPSLANLLRVCNPGLVGGSRGQDSAILPSGGGRGLNVAVSGDWAGGAEDQALELVERMRKVPGYHKKWKLITVQLGGNDVCSYNCDTILNNGDASPRAFKRNISSMLRVLYSLPRTIVLLLQPQDFSQYSSLPDRGLICDLILTNSCSCLFDGNLAANTVKMKRLLTSYSKIYHQLARQFRRDDFAVEVIPGLLGLPPKERRGYRQVVSKAGLSHDCFHYNGRTQAMIGINLWNNLIEAPDHRTSVYGRDLKLKCPAEGQTISLSNYLRYNG